jgi:hypothetical protein
MFHSAFRTEPPTAEERAEADKAARIAALKERCEQAAATAARGHDVFVKAMKDVALALERRDALLHRLWTIQDEMTALGATVPPHASFSLPVVENEPRHPLATAQALYPEMFR